jgi:hypothetical protein
MVIVLDSPRAAAPVSRWRTSPARMTTTLITLLVIATGFGVSGVVGAIQRTDGGDHIRASSGPLAVAAQSLYRSLSDADATEAGAFLAAGAEPASSRTRYLDDIAAATSALTSISAATTDTADLRTLAAGLPTYTGLVETARADNHVGLPVGAAYLREASGLMRTELLPAAQRLYADQSARLADDSATAGGFPWLSIPLGLIALIGLVRAQRVLARRTHRVFNVGLVAATVSVVIALGWITVAWAVDAAHLSSAMLESRRTNVIVATRIDVLNARADESLELISRGADPRYETDFTDVMHRLGRERGWFEQALTAPAPAGVRAAIPHAESAIAAWGTEHTGMLAANSKGDYTGAVAMTIGGGPDRAPAFFGAADTALGQAIDASNSTLDTDAAQAGDALTGLAVGTGLLTAIALAAMTVGFQRRIAEYR